MLERAGSRWRATITDASNPLTVGFDDASVLREMVGELGAHLKMVGSAFQVQVGQRGNVLTISGEDAAVQSARSLLENLYRLVESGHIPSPADVRHAIRLQGSSPGADLREYFGDVVLTDVKGRPISPRTPNQRSYLNALRSHDIVFGVGPAGTGKTYMAIATAVAAFLRHDVKRIVLTRPAVEAGEKLGFLPGDLTEKVDPYLRPIYDALRDMLPPDRFERMLERGDIEIAPLAFMRGRTLNDAYVILDEGQNTTIEQMRMFLTRLGDRGRMVITGDVTQVDLPPRRTSGMRHALKVLDNVGQIAVCRLTSADVVRHPLVAEIIEAYESDDRARIARRQAEASA